MSVNSLDSIRALPNPIIGPVPGRTSCYEWRGILIDSARTCHTVESIKKVLQLAKRYGFNRIHWHLNDDQGWRFAVPEYPKITTESAFLERDDFARYDNLYKNTQSDSVTQAPGRWHNGYYTDEEITEIVEIAQSLNIIVVPELDFPGHMGAAIQAYPELGRPKSVPIPNSGVDSRWAARNDLLWPTEKAIKFLLASLDKVCDLFPDSYVHIGGDECAFAKWEVDSRLQAWAKEHGLSSIPDIQGWFMRHGIDRLRQNGKIPVVWDEACTMVDSDVLVMAWDEQRSMNRIASTSHKYIYTDARYLYLNRIDPESKKEQKGMVPGISVKDILASSWEEAQDNRCVGVQTCFWSEFILDETDLLNMMFPRLLAVSERIWQPNGDSAEDAIEIVEKEYQILCEAGIL